VGSTGKKKYDAIVVGLGGMGGMTAYQLAKRGASVLALEQFGIPNRLGSSGGGSRMMRKIYHEHPDYLPMLDRAYDLWRQLQVDSNSEFLHIHGGLYIGEPDCDSISGAIAVAEEHSIPHAVLEQPQIHEQFPQFSLTPNYVGLYEPTAGWIEPERAISAACHCALLAGAELRGYESVQNWREDSQGVTVTTGGGDYRADQLIFCGGAWTSLLFRDWGVQLWVSRQVVGWLSPRSPQQFVSDRFPVWSFRRKDGTRLYGFPMSSAAPGIKVANHDRSDVTEVNALQRQILPTDEASFREGLAQLLPAANGNLLSLEICIYTNSPDFNFVIGRVPRHQRILVACGFSGHGFKFCSVIGQIMADLALTGHTDLEVGFLNPERFQ
jgi:sarcosine oxidase